MISTALCAASGPFMPICIGAVTGVISGVIVGIQTGSFDLALKAGLISGVTAAAMYGVRRDHQDALRWPDGEHGFKVPILGRAACLQCRCACGSSAVDKPLLQARNAALPRWPVLSPRRASPVIANLDFVSGLMASAALGGAAAVAGGGKFANGAQTGAFGYLYNAAAKTFAGGFSAGFKAGFAGDFSDIETLRDGTPSAMAGVAIGNIVGGLSESVVQAGAFILGASALRLSGNGSIVGRGPANLTEQLAMKEAQSGGGTRIMEGGFGDSLYKAAGWEKWEVVTRMRNGNNVVVHYMKNVRTGLMEQFKFK